MMEPMYICLCVFSLSQEQTVIESSSQAYRSKGRDDQSSKYSIIDDRVMTWYSKLAENVHTRYHIVTAFSV